MQRTTSFLTGVVLSTLVGCSIPQKPPTQQPKSTAKATTIALPASGEDYELPASLQERVQRLAAAQAGYITMQRKDNAFIFS